MCDLGRLETPFSMTIVVVAVPVIENALMRQAPLFTRAQQTMSLCVSAEDPQRSVQQPAFDVPTAVLIVDKM